MSLNTTSTAISAKIELRRPSVFALRLDDEEDALDLGDILQDAVQALP